MSDVLRLNLIHLFTFYLAAAFALSTLRRLRQYHDIVHLALSAPGRWPRVMKQIQGHWWMFLTWATLRPAAIAMLMLGAQTVCSRLLWPSANLTIDDLLHERWMLALVILAAIAMLSLDIYFILAVGGLDRKVAEKYLDEAEHWLTSWKSPLIATLTFGYISPRRIVAVEVKKAVEEGRGMLQSTLWWWAAQAGLRIVFGLTLWISWVVMPVPELHRPDAAPNVSETSLDPLLSPPGGIDGGNDNPGR